MSDGVVEVSKPFVVLIEHVGLAVPAFVFEFSEKESAATAAKTWAEHGFVEHTGPGMPPNHEPIWQYVALREPFRILVMSKSEHTLQVREIRAAQMSQQAAMAPRLVSR